MNKIIKKIVFITISSVCILQTDFADSTQTPAEKAAAALETIENVKTASPEVIKDPKIQAAFKDAMKSLASAEVVKEVIDEKTYNELLTKGFEEFRKNLKHSIAAIFADKLKTMKNIKKEEQMEYHKAWKIVIRDTFCGPLDVIFNPQYNPNAKEMLGYLNSLYNSPRSGEKNKKTDRQIRQDISALCGSSSYGDQNGATFKWADIKKEENNE